MQCLPQDSCNCSGIWLIETHGCVSNCINQASRCWRLPAQCSGFAPIVVAINSRSTQRILRKSAGIFFIGACMHWMVSAALASTFATPTTVRNPIDRLPSSAFKPTALPSSHWRYNCVSFLTHPINPSIGVSKVEWDASLTRRVTTMFGRQHVEIRRVSKVEWHASLTRRVTSVFGRQHVETRRVRNVE